MYLNIFGYGLTIKCSISLLDKYPFMHGELPLPLCSYQIYIISELKILFLMMMAECSLFVLPLILHTVIYYNFMATHIKTHHRFFFIDEPPSHLTNFSCLMLIVSTYLSISVKHFHVSFSYSFKSSCLN